MPSTAPVPDLWGDVGPFVGITRAALHHALRGAPNRCRSGTSATSLEQQHEQMRVTFDDGSSAEYDLVVGADGIGSVIRRCISRLPRPVDTGQMAWRSIAPVRPDGLDGVEFWLGADRFFGLCPTGNGTTYGFGNLATTRCPDPVAGRAGRLRDTFADFGTRVQQYLAALPHDRDIHCAPVEWLPDVVWHAGRVALVGDAAHAMSPMMGQGGCLAIEDAVVLADELHRTTDVPTALAAFAARRRERVEWVRTQSAELGELIRLPAHIRDQALRERGVKAFHDRYRPLIGAP
jgi:2-polyprenyl-6-methoxyphenol hydroxylase-like FAD-dependent oxidoreductase